MVGCRESGGIFYDIGSGTGKPALAAALLHDFDQVNGIEILDGLYRISLEIQGAGRKRLYHCCRTKKRRQKLSLRGVMQH